MNLDRLRVSAAHPLPTAAQHNALAAHLRSCAFNGVTEDIGDPARPRHNWRVRVQRFASRAGSTLDPETTWQITLQPGCILDRLPSILYRRAADPRGWSKPAGYVEAPAAAPDSTWIDRDVLDDLADPPVLILRDPPAPDFTRVTDDRRRTLEGGAFCSAVDWDRELWRASVLLSARPVNQVWQSIALPPPRLNRHRLYTSTAAPSAVDAAAGIAYELATIYLLRDPSAPDSAEIRVRQREFFGFWAQIVQPGFDLLQTLDQQFDGFGLDAFAGTASVETWTV